MKGVPFLHCNADWYAQLGKGGTVPAGRGVLGGLAGMDQIGQVVLWGPPF